MARSSSGTPDRSADEWASIKQEVMNGERTASLFDITNPIDFRNSGGLPTMSDSLGSFGEGMSSGSVIVQGTRTFDPTKDSLLFNGQNGDGSTLVRKSLPDGSTIDTYANGYNVTDANGNAAFTVADTSGTVLTGKLYQEAADRNYYLSKKYDPNSLGDQVLNIFTGAMNDPDRVMTDRERTEHESLSNMFLHQTDMALNPERYSPLLQRLDSVRESAAATGAYLAANAAGANQATQDRFAGLAHAAGNVTFARSTAINGGPAYTGARGTPTLAPSTEIDISKPYANPKSRPAYGPGQQQAVWDQAAARSSNGTVYDPNTGGQLTWDQSRSRAGQWDMGHLPGNGYAELHTRYMSGEIPLSKFLEIYRDPRNYVPESPSANRSRRYEGN